MKQNFDYVLTEISGKNYILPYGQQIADQMRGIEVNETGRIIWEFLKDEHSLDETLFHLKNYYEMNDTEFLEAKKDIISYINLLTSMDIILLKDKYSSILEPYICSVCIAGINIDFYGKETVIPSEFNKFKCDKKENPDMQLVLTNTILYKPFGKQNGTILIHTNELIVTKREDDYQLFFPSTCNIKEASINKAGSLAYVRYLPSDNDTLLYDIFHTIRFLFLYKAWTKGFLALHSASILYKDKVWLFSGHSGMGKSTHTNLWNKLYDTPIINGDLNLIDCSNDTALIYGTPWCGTSGICDAKTYELAGIVLLNKAPDNRVEELSDDKKILFVSQRFISPAWDECFFNTNLHLTKGLAEKIHIFRYHCTKEDEAANIIKSYIDEII